MSLTGTSQLGTPAPFITLAAPWLLQGVLLICAMHGHPPFFGNTGGDAYSNASGPISGTAIFIIRTGIWLLTLFILLPLRQSVTALSRSSLILFCLPVLAVMSTLWSTAPKITLGTSFELLLLTTAGIYIGSSFSVEQQMQLFMITGALAAAFSLLMAGVDPKDGLDPFGHIGALKGIFTHKNSCGFFMVVLSTPAFFIRRSMPISRLLVSSYLALCGLTVVLSQSRTAWIDFAFIAIAARSLPLFRAFGSKDRIVVFAFSVACVAVVIVLLIVNLDAALAILGKDPSFSGRTLIWQAVLQAIGKRPLLGYGYGAFFSSLDAGAGSLVMQTRFVVNHPHNGYLSIWLDLGIAGLAFFGLSLWRAAANCTRAWRNVPTTDWYLCLLALTLIENLSEVGLASANDLSWLVFVVACTGLNRVAQSTSAQLRQPLHSLMPAMSVA